MTSPTINDFSNESAIFYGYGLNDSLKIIFDDGMLFQGVATSREFKHLRLRILLYNVTDDYLENLYIFFLNNPGKLKLFYSDFSLQLTNYTNPAEKSFSFFSDTLDININKKTTMEFSVNNVTTDYGFLMEKNYKENLCIINYSTNTLTSLRSYESLIFYEVNFILSKYSPVYIRSYMKIPELLANIGGILNVIVIFFGYLSNYLSIYFLNINLMNEIFEFDKYILDDSTKAIKIRLDRDFNYNKRLKNQALEEGGKWTGKTNLNFSKNNHINIIDKSKDISNISLPFKNLSDIHSYRSDASNLRKLINENSQIENNLTPKEIMKNDDESLNPYISGMMGNTQVLKRNASLLSEINNIVFNHSNQIQKQSSLNKSKILKIEKQVIPFENPSNPINKNPRSTTSCESKSIEIPKIEIKSVNFSLKNNISNFNNSNPHITFQDASKMIPNNLDETKKSKHKNLKDFSRIYEIFKNRKNNKKVEKNFFTNSDIMALILPSCFKKSNYYSRKVELYQKALRYLQNYIDYTRVVKKTMEIDLLKFLLLDYDQINMYNLIKRPFITLDKKTSETPRCDLSNFSEVFAYYSNSCPKSSYDMKFLPKESKVLYNEFYYNFLNKEEKSDIDLKIINSLHSSEVIQKNLSE
jgi:hypothetical protein